jgi:hypothetical protein
VPVQPVAPAAQSTEAFEVDTADGPEGAGFCPGRASSGPEDAWESVLAWQPPSSTVQSPLPEEIFARPLSTAASAPDACECTLPEHWADPPGQVTEPVASETLSRAPGTVDLAAATVPVAVPLAVRVSVSGLVGAGVCVGWVNRVAELDWDPQLPAVAAQSDEPVEVFAAAGVAVPVVGSIVTSPEPVEEVFDDPLPEQCCVPLGQVTALEAPLELVVGPVLVSPLNRSAHGDCWGLDACEPDWLWQPPPATVQLACPVVALCTSVVFAVAGARSAGAVVVAGFVPAPVWAPPVTAAVPAGMVSMGMVSVWVALAPVLVVAEPVQPVAPATHWALACACGPPCPAPVSASRVAPPSVVPALPAPPVPVPVPVPVVVSG